jgi:hypothetical protein
MYISIYVEIHISSFTPEMGEWFGRTPVSGLKIRKMLKITLTEVKSPDCEERVGYAVWEYVGLAWMYEIYHHWLSCSTHYPDSYSYLTNRIELSSWKLVDIGR